MASQRLLVDGGNRAQWAPAWQFRFDDDDLWAIVAYLQMMPSESPQQYRNARPTGVAAAAGLEAAATHGDTRRGIIALRQEASALRALAERIDLAPIRDRLLELAARCEVLAESMEGPEAVPELARKQQQLVN